MIILYREVTQKHETEIPDALESCGKVKKKKKHFQAIMWTTDQAADGEKTTSADTCMTK